MLRALDGMRGAILPTSARKISECKMLFDAGVDTNALVTGIEVCGSTGSGAVAGGGGGGGGQMGGAKGGDTQRARDGHRGARGAVVWWCVAVMLLLLLLLRCLRCAVVVWQPVVCARASTITRRIPALNRTTHSTHNPPRAHLTHTLLTALATSLNKKQHTK